MRKLIVLVGLAMVAVLAFEALNVSDAEAGKRKKPPPNYTFVLCAGHPNTCSGAPSADLMVGADGFQTLLGGAGNDIYMSSDGAFDSYIDESTSSDLYGGFVNGDFVNDTIDDRGGLDRVDLSTSVSSYASTDFEFFKVDRDSDGAQDDLNMKEKNFDNNDNIFALNHFGSGRIEYIKFSDKVVLGASVPLS